MRFRSFQSAARAALRAVIVAAVFAPVASAEWRSPTLPISASCLVHDSGLEFLPVRYHANQLVADPLAGIIETPSNDALTVINEPALPAPELEPIDWDACILSMHRSERMGQLVSALQWLRSQRPVWLAALREGAQSIQHGFRDAAQVTERWIEHGLVALAASRTASNGATLANASAATYVAMDYAALDAEPCDARVLGDDAWNRDGNPSVCSNDSEAADAGLLPSGRAANLFVFVLSNFQAYELTSPESSSQFPAVAVNTDGNEGHDTFGAEFADAFASRNGTSSSDANAIAAGPCYPNEACFPYEPFSVEQDAPRARDAASESLKHETAAVLSSASTENAPESSAPEDLVIAEPIPGDVAMPADEIQQCGPGVDRFERSVAAQPERVVNRETVGAEPKVLAPSDARLGTADWAAANSIRFGCLDSDWNVESGQSPCRPPVLSAPDDEPLPAYASSDSEPESASPSLHALSLDKLATPVHVDAPDEASSVIASEAMWVGMAMQEGRTDAASPTGPRLAAMPQAGPLGGDSTAESEAEAMRDTMQPDTFLSPVETSVIPQPTHQSFEPYPPITESMDAAWIDAEVRETLRVRPFELSPWTDCDLNAPSESDSSQWSEADSQSASSDSIDAPYLDSVRCLGFE